MKAVSAVLAVLLFIGTEVWAAGFVVTSFLRDVMQPSEDVNTTKAVIYWLSSDLHWLQLLGVLALLAGYGAITALFLHEPKRWSYWVTKPFLLVLGYFYFLSGIVEAIVAAALFILLFAAAIVAGLDGPQGVFVAAVLGGTGAGSIWLSTRLFLPSTSRPRQ